MRALTLCLVLPGALGFGYFPSYGGWTDSAYGGFCEGDDEADVGFMGSRDECIQACSDYDAMTWDSTRGICYCFQEDWCPCIEVYEDEADWCWCSGEEEVSQEECESIGANWEIGDDWAECEFESADMCTGAGFEMQCETFDTPMAFNGIADPPPCEDMDDDYRRRHRRRLEVTKKANQSKKGKA